MKKYITIQLQNPAELNEKKYALYAFMACQSNLYTAGYTLCWNKSTDFFSSVQLSWTNDYGGYFSNTKIGTGQQIYIPQPHQSTEDAGVSGSCVKLLQGKTVTLNKNHGTTIKSNSHDTLGLNNESTHAVSSGISIRTQGVNGFEYTGTVVFHQADQKSYDIMPSDKVFLMMVADQSITEQMVVVESLVPGPLINLNTDDDTHRSLSYDINSGWSGLNISKDKVLPKGTNLSDFLITTLFLNSTR